MKRPEKQLTAKHLALPLSAKETRRLLAYLLRATLRRASKETLGEHRYGRLTGEVAHNLTAMALKGRSPLGFYTELCQRFGIDATGSDTEWGPIEAWLPEGRLRWDRALAVMDFTLMRTLIDESPEFLATFARSFDEDDSDFDLFPDPATDVSLYRPTLPERTLPTRGFHAVWTLSRNLHHGADQKSGNTNLFRRQPVYDPLTGKTYRVPFLSGNSIRGQWRDLAMGRWLDLLGLSPTDIPTGRAHSLLSGGSVEQGSDSATVDNEIRRKVRDLCPPFDLLGGNMEQQIMSGRCRVGDGILVCRENAWLVRDVVSSGEPLESFAATLPEAESLLHVRQGVRSKHAEIRSSDGVQMLFNQELLNAGCQLVHTVQVWTLDRVPEVTLSCLSDLLTEFQGLGGVGASTARGFGGVSFDGYLAGPDTKVLPTNELYLENVEKRRDEILEWLLSEPKKVEKKSKKAKKPELAEAAE